MYNLNWVKVNVLLLVMRIERNILNLEYCVVGGVFVFLYVIRGLVFFFEKICER